MKAASSSRFGSKIIDGAFFSVGKKSGSGSAGGKPV